MKHDAFECVINGKVTHVSKCVKRNAGEPHVIHIEGGAFYTFVKPIDDTVSRKRIGYIEVEE